MTLFDRRQVFLASAGLALAPPLLALRRDRLGHNSIADALDGYVARRRLAGCVASFARGTDDAQYFASGTLAFDSRRRIDADNLFRIYSQTKPVTGIAAMLLIEDGKLGLDQDIADFIPAFRHPRVAPDWENSLDSRPAAGPITVRHLLTHTAGLGYSIITKGALRDAYLRDGINPAVVSRRSVPGWPLAPTAPSLAVFADRVAALPLIADPGTRWSYSIGLDVLGRVIEVAGGMPFDRFLRERLFDPLGMTSTFFRVPRSQLHRMTTNYGIAPEGNVVIDPGPTTIYAKAPAFAFGGAGLVSSARDFDRFMRMLAGLGAIGRTRVMKAETARLAMSNLLPPSVTGDIAFAAGQGFGAGGKVKISDDGTAAGIGTFGWGGAAATIFWVDPTRGMRAAGYAQYMPQSSLPFTDDFLKAAYAGL